MATNDAPDAAQQSAPLKRVMGPKLLLLFIVGDILGTGVYALTGQVAKEVGGAAWLPFLVAFGVALLTALSYLELVTKYPKAAGAALYVHKAFGVHFLTFIVCFTVMCSGLTSAATASQAFAANLFAAFGIESIGGYVKVDEELRTSHPKVFAAGDCVRLTGHALTVTAAEDGKIAAIYVVRNPDKLRHLH